MSHCEICMEPATREDRDGIKYCECHAVADCSEFEQED